MEGGGARVRAELSRRSRLTLLDQMSAIAADGREHAGLTLDDILNLHKRTTAADPPPPSPPPPETPGRTLLDVIRDEDPKANSFKGFGGSRDKKSWRSFKERIRLKRSGSGAAWTSSVLVPTSDIMIPTSRPLFARENSDRAFFSDSPPSSSSPRRRSLEMVMSQRIGEDDIEGNDANNGNPSLRPQISRRTSCRFADVPSVLNHNNDDVSDTAVPGNSNSNGNSNPSLRPQISRRHSLRFSPSTEDSPEPPPPLPERDGSRRLSTVLAEERSLSAREAVAAQEAAEAASTAAAEEEVAAESVAPARMSLMDLLEETDRQMGVVGSRYLFGDDDEEEEEAVETLVAAAEKNCCVCLVRHKGAAFIPCGHTFCRLCSRELWVSRGNCPLCNGFILEILDIF